MTESKEKRGRGRPSKLTDERREKIVNLIKLGCYRETACAQAGIDPRTFRIWLRKGEEGNSTYAAFVKEIEEAEAQAENSHVLKITKAATHDWKAAAWILARKYTARWGDKMHIDVQLELRERLKDILKIVEDEGGPELAARIYKRLAG